MSVFTSCSTKDLNAIGYPLRQKIVKVIVQYQTFQKRSQKEVKYSNKKSDPMEQLYLDFFRKHSPQSNGYSYILSCRDSFCRFIELQPTKDMPATTVITPLSSNIFAYFGLPCCIKSDIFTSFTNNLLKEVCNRLQYPQKTPPFDYCPT